MPSSPARHRVAALLLASLAAPLAARAPLTIPAWADLRLEAARGLEVEEDAGWVLTLEALAGPVLVSPPSLLAGPGVVLHAGPAPAESRLLRAGESFRWHFRATVESPGPEPWLEAVVEADCPLVSLEARVRELYPDAPRESTRELIDRIRRLPRRQALRARVQPGLTLEEGVLAGRGPEYRGYLEVPGASPPVRYAVWDPPPEAGTGAARQAMASASPQLRALLLAAGVRQDGQDGGKSRYRELLARQRQGEDTAAALDTLARDPGTAPEVALATRNLLAVSLAAAGDHPRAAEFWGDLASSRDLGYYFEYNRAESLRVQGLLAPARDAYRRALERRPVFTLARRRLAALGTGEE